MEQIEFMYEWVGMFVYKITDNVTKGEVCLTVGHGRLHSCGGNQISLIDSAIALINSLA